MDEMLKNYTAITGRQPLPRAGALGTLYPALVTAAKNRYSR